MLGESEIRIGRFCLFIVGAIYSSLSEDSNGAFENHDDERGFAKVSGSNK